MPAGSPAGMIFQIFRCLEFRKTKCPGNVPFYEMVTPNGCLGGQSLSRGEPAA